MVSERQKATGEREMAVTSWSVGVVNPSPAQLLYRHPSKLLT